MRLPILLLALLCQLMSFSANAQTLTNIDVLQEEGLETGDLRSFVLTPSFQANLIEGRGSTRDKQVEYWQSASTVLRKQADKVAKLVKMQNQYPGIIITDRDSPDEIVRSAAFTLLAHQPISILQTYYTTFNIDGIYRTAVEHEIETIKELIRKASLPSVIISATGNIRSLASNQETATPGANGTGTLGATFATAENIWSAHLAVASTLDTLHGELGGAILSPMSGKFLKCGSLEWYTQIKGKRWVHTYATMASQNWEIDDTTHREASIFGLGILYHYRLINGKISNTDIGLDLEIGLSSRWIGGNVRNLLASEAGKEKYLKAFPSDAKGFIGIEAGFALNFGQVVGALQTYYYFADDLERIDHLTGLQLSVGLSVRGDLLRAFVDSKD